MSEVTSDVSGALTVVSRKVGNRGPVEGVRSEPTVESLTPGRRTVLALVVCRATFRGLWLLAPLLLATTWSARDLALTVTAIGGFGWCAVMLASTEKTILKHVPRLPRLSGQVSRTALGVVTVPLALALLVAIPLTLVGETAAIYAWGLVWATVGGLLQTVAALHRLDRRAWIDGLLFGGGAAWLLAVTGATIVAAWSPTTWLIACVSGLLAISGVALVALRPRLSGVRRPAALVPITRSLLLLGLPEVLSLASVSAGYWALAATSSGAATTDATLFYAAVTAAGMAGSLTVYLVRLGQPDVSLRARSHGPAVVLAEARRWLDQALLTGFAVGVVALAAHVLGAPGWLTLIGLTLGEIVIFTQRTIGVNRIENATSRRLPMNVAASAVGFAVACATLVLFADRAGAHAAMGALVAAQLVNAAVLRTVTRPSDPESTTTTLASPEVSSACPEPAITGLSVVIPCFNEQSVLDATIDEVLAELADFDLEIVCVDDGSRDGTLEVLRRRAAEDHRIHYLSFTRNFGVEAAFSAGYAHASKPWLVHLDADGQFPPAEVRRMVAASAGMDAVFGVRRQRNDPWLRRVGSAVNQFIARRLLGIELPARATCFRLVRTDLARAVVDLRLGSPYFLATLPRLTSRYRMLPVSHRPRGDGPARVRVAHLAGQAMDLWFAFSRRPAQLAMGLAWIAALVAGVLGLAHLGGGLPTALLEAGLAVLAGVLLLVVAVLVRCVGVVTASQPRPRQYYIREATMPVQPEDTFGALTPAPVRRAAEAVR